VVVKNAKHEVTAVKPEQYPINSIPEVAFVGRSNVGKSSVINTLLNRRNLARVGSTPGKTRQINFFNVDDALYFVDLPGYGYANVSKGERQSWGRLVETYLSTREQLQMIIMLVDIRHTPTRDDVTMYEWILNSGLPHIIAAAKADKISRSQVRIRITDIEKTLKPAEYVEVIPFSSENKAGKEELWKKINSILNPGNDAGITSP